MPATYRISEPGGDTAGTGNRTVAIVPAVGDLLVVFVSLAGNVATLTMTDDNGGGGTYVRVADALWGASANNSAVFVRNALIQNTDTTIITCISGSNTAGVLVAVAVQGMLRAGLSAVRGIGSQANQASGGTPTPVLDRSALTTNLTMTAVASGDIDSSPNASWTEREDINQSTPTVAIQVATRNSGFTGTSIAYAASQSADFASFAIEIDGSAPTVPQTETILKSYFETGDQPTETQFAEFVGTMFYLFQIAMDVSTEALEAAAEALARQPQALVKATWDGSNYNRATGYINVDPIADTGNTIRVTWTVPFLNDDYKVLVSPFSGTDPRHNNVLKVAQTAAYVELEFWNESVSSAGKPEFHLAAFT